MTTDATTIDTAAATAFLAGHGRVLDRRRLALLLGTGDAAGVLGALEAYRNADGGYGWGLEADLRSPESQTGAALHAFEALAEVAPVRSARAVELCDWLAGVSLPDGGVPFALPVTDPAGSAPWWLDADQDASSLQITAAVCAQALRVARHDPDVAGHPWLAGAVDYCVTAAATVDRSTHPYELSFALQALDAAADRHPDARAALARLAGLLPADGALPVPGGAEGETLRPLDYSPLPGGPLRELLPDGVIAADLDRLAALQQPDGGWVVDFVSASPAGSLAWRGYATVEAVAILRAHGATGGG
jgi:hypothetical protein